MSVDAREPSGPRRSSQLKSIRQKLREHLENERRRVYEEIRNYPTPIAGCDVQFNFLLEQLRSISQDLDRLEAMGGEDLADIDLAESLDALIKSSACIRQDVQQALAAELCRAQTKLNT